MRPDPAPLPAPLADEATHAAKAVLRQRLLAERRAVAGDERARASAAVITTLRSLPELAPVTNVLLYAARPDEIDLSALIAAAPPGWQVHLPRMDGRRLLPVALTPATVLSRGAFGIAEPDGPVVDPARLDAVIVPGVAFTAQGLRLGHGAGVYDRALLALRTDAVTVGVCAERFVVDELPTAPHDVPVGLVVTDASVRRRTPTTPSGAA
jgi:5-formyltetrahydrofolate cyclo-ligase